MIYKSVIGVDPGTSTGWAVVDILNRELIILETLDFWSAHYTLASDVVLPEETIVVIEVPRNKKNWHGAGAAVDVGGVVREAALFADGAERLGFSVERVHPRGKIPSKNFNRITGWTGRSNEHTRDAGMLAWSKMKELTRS